MHFTEYCKNGINWHKMQLVNNDILSKTQYKKGGQNHVAVSGKNQEKKNNKKVQEDRSREQQSNLSSAAVHP